MDEKKIAFIICSNNAQYYNECVGYIQELEIPQGYMTDVICIQEADSMASGYNAGMQASDAKYKVYLHQDTFIINKNFIRDSLDIFLNDETIGMFGVIGATELPGNASCYLSWRYGKIITYDGRTVGNTEFLAQRPDKKAIPVAAVDGVLMMTQYDVPWREDFLDGWDFYDISQSIEMRKAGYQVVVPYQEQAWCYHDCGVSKLKKYDYYRAKMIQQYPDVFAGQVDEKESVQKLCEMKELEQIRGELANLWASGAFEELKQIADAAREKWMLDTQIRDMMNLMEIYILEERSIAMNGKHSELFYVRDWDEAYELYKQIHLAVIKNVYNESERPQITTMFQEKVKCCEISADMIRKVSAISVQNTESIRADAFTDNGEKPLVSVCVKRHSGEKYLEQTLQSVQRQSYSNLEIIIADNTASMNEAMQHAHGTYIALLEQGDVWRIDKLEKQVAFLEEHPDYGACFCWSDIIDDKGQVISTYLFELYKRFCPDNFSSVKWSYKMIMEGSFFCTSSACIRKSILDKIGYYHYGLNRVPEYDLWLRIAKASDIYVLQEKMAMYRKLEGDGRIPCEEQGLRNCEAHERQWIVAQYIKDLSAQEFANVFQTQMRRPRTQSDKEVRCEKAFFLKKVGNYFWMNQFMELYGDAECRELLQQQYQLKPGDFAHMNEESILLDDALLKSLEKQQRIIEKMQQNR